MKTKCSHCSKTTDVTFDSLIFENEDEELFIIYLTAEMSHLPNEDCIPEETRK